jgi:hypothetical protein
LSAHLLNIPASLSLQAKRQTQHGRALACAASQAVTEAALAHGSHDNITTLTMVLDWDGEML